jgi:hypothetical protein
VNGNVRCSLLERYGGKITQAKNKWIDLPIFYTRYLADSTIHIPEKYKQLIL